MTIRTAMALAGAVTLAGCGASGASFGGPDMAIEGGEGIHVIGFYEGPSDHGGGKHPTGEVTLMIEDQGDARIALAITSYEPVRVTVSGPGAEDVSAVYLDGHYRHEVEGLGAGVRTINYSGGEKYRPYQDPYQEPDDWGGANGSFRYIHQGSGSETSVDPDFLANNARVVLGSGAITSVTQGTRVASIVIESP